VRFGPLEQTGITSSRVLAAMRQVDREQFTGADPADERAVREAYEDRPLPIGCGQTISQPYIVAYMTQELDIRRGDRVLEVGTGSGYQAAILAELTDEVFSIEIIPTLAARARAVLDRLGYDHVQTRVGDGGEGWPEHAPYQAIIATAAATHIPEPLVRQLDVGGRLIAPVGRAWDVQYLTLVERTSRLETRSRRQIAVRFVPLTGSGGS
jgi:protein-L-isoaspartate(D-aspartate) O-methyltransferase